MVTTVADSLFNRLIDAFPADRAYGADDFARKPMPGPLRAYLERRLATHLDDVLDPEHAWIDADHPEVRAATRSFRKAVSGHGRVPASAWHGELKLACRTVVSYLIRPVPVLTDMVFAEGEEDADWEEIAEGLRHLPAYSYFYDVISAYVEQKGVERVSRERVASLARRIDHQMVRDFGAEEWMRLIDPLLDVVWKIPKYSTGVPVYVIRAFLEEKGAGDLVGCLDAFVRSDADRLLTTADLQELFERPVEEPAVEESKESADSERRTDERETSDRGSHVPLWKQFESGLHPASSHEARSAPVTSGDAAPANPAEAQPLWKQYHGSSRGPSAESVESPPRGEAPRSDESALSDESARSAEYRRPSESRRSDESRLPDESRPRDDARPSESRPPHESTHSEVSTRWRETSRHYESQRPNESERRRGSWEERSAWSAPEKDQRTAGRGTDERVHTPTDLAALERSVLGGRGGRNRDLFLRHLFSGSEEAYEDTLRKLDAAENWSEASQIIAKEVFLKHQVNIYSDPAVAFTDAAEARYRS